MNWNDHYTTYKFQGLYLIQAERFLQTELNEMRAKQNLQLASHDVIDNEDVYDDEIINDENSDEERFQVQSTEDKNNFILVNTRIDYQYRSDNLNNTCLYDFVGTFYQKKINETDLKYLSNSSTTEKRQDNQKGRPSNERFSFQEEHLQAATHILMKYSQLHVPVLYGRQIPRQDRDDTRERYNRGLLTLFVPWRNAIDLCGIIENIQLLHECKKGRDEHLLQVIAEAQVENDSIDPAFLPSNQDADSEYEVDDIDDLIQLIGNVDEFTAAAINATKKSTENVYIRETVEAVEKVGRFNHMNYDDTLDFNDVTDAVITVINPYNNRSNFEKYSSIPSVLVVKNNFSAQNSILDEFTLNKEQRAAFLIIKNHLDGDSRCRKEDNNGQFIMCIPGCGGTVKSQLIRALTKYFFITKRIQMMRKLAPTGIAAAEIDGMTIHSFLGEQRNSGKPRIIKPGDSKLEKEWRPVEYLLIDEMSMVGLTLLAKLNRIICSAKHVDPQVPFGGVNVIFFGDYLQYRPVYDSPLHTDFSLPSKKKQGKPSSEKEIQQRVARSLILQIYCVVKLTQQMRTEDLRYLQLLDRLRHGQCNYDDYELLQTRVVGKSSTESLHDSPWNKAPILVFRNEIRTKLNNKASIHNATQIDHPLMVGVAQDTCKGKPIEDPILVKNLLELSDSKTEHLPGLLPFVPGMPVILTQNIATELGLINGIKGTFRQLVYHEESINKCKIECKLQDLEPKLIPIPLVEQTFRVDIADILPKDKKPKSNQKTILSIKRSALPLVPAYCITTHKSQGQTLNKVVIDLKLPNETDDIAAVYVPLSRVKRLVDLAILRPFDYKVLLMKPNKSQVAEMERLDQLYTNTQRRFSEWFQ
ncbi:unnamed protein product [Rotaria sp. Silwood2]|nr:unnamed protein product [Rotaria sp. Silwood2]CAF4308437.1 unnamed protein product [Rotaria sp. Silwood2]